MRLRNGPDIPFKSRRSHKEKKGSLNTIPSSFGLALLSFQLLLGKNVYWFSLFSPQELALLKAMWPELAHRN